MSQQPLVVQVVPYFPPHIGGVEEVARVLASSIADKGPVLVLTSRCGARDAPRLEQSGNLTVKRLPSTEVANLPLMPTLLWHLFRLPPRSVVHVHLAQALVPELVRLSALVRRHRYITHFHLDVEPSGPFGALFSVYKRFVLGGTIRSAAKVIALSSAQSDFLVERYGVAADRVVVIPNGVDRKYFGKDQDRHPRREGDALRLLYVGRLAPQKNLHRLLQAAARVTEPIDVVVVGDGVDRAGLAAEKIRLGLDNVRLVGPAFGDDLVRWYRWADVFIMPSDKEGMPLALLQAMAAGLPVLATDVDGIRETLDSDGLLVAPDPDALAVAMERLSQDVALRSALAQRSRRRATQFGWSGSVERLNDLYLEITA